MHSKSYTIIINKPSHDAFITSLIPKNTPLWIDGIAEEQTNESPARLGTIYKNRGHTGGWTEYSITEFDKDKSFTLSRKDGAYHVRYVFKTLNDNQTEFTYSEWEDKGELKNPLPKEAIQKFKQLVEKQ